MTSEFDRRSFLAGALASSLLHPLAMAGAADKSAASKPLLDIHVHLFGTGDGGTGCRISKSITEGLSPQSLQFRGLVYALGLEVKGKTLDQRYEEVLTEQVKSSGLAMAAIVGQDAVYDRHGKTDWGTHIVLCAQRSCLCCGVTARRMHDPLPLDQPQPG